MQAQLMIPHASRFLSSFGELSDDEFSEAASEKRVDKIIKTIEKAKGKT